MQIKKKLENSKINQQFQVPQPWNALIILLLNILITIPLFIIAHKNIIEFNWPYELDHILLFIGILTINQFVLHQLRTVLIISIGLYLMALIIGNLTDNYGFKSIYDDYKYMLYALQDSPHPQDILLNKFYPFPEKTAIINAIEYNKPAVRDFALGAIDRHFKHVPGYEKHRKLIQCFAIFKEINSQWNYVSDPKNEEYIASASESIVYLAGDCDDHSVLMAACIKAIGGNPRLIHTDGHIYPEICIGTLADIETVNFLIKKELFIKESQNKSIHYHRDEYGQVWLNMDYTAMYPGGPFLFDTILGTLNLD
jgi:hypothetical protein